MILPKERCKREVADALGAEAVTCAVNPKIILVAQSFWMGEKHATHRENAEREFVCLHHCHRAAAAAPRVTFAKLCCDQREVGSLGFQISVRSSPSVGGRPEVVRAELALMPVVERP